MAIPFFKKSATLLLLSLATFATAQEIIYSIPLEGNNLKGQKLYDTDDYSVVTHYFNSSDYVYLLKKGAGVVGQHKALANTKYRGYTSTENSFVVYYTFEKKNYAIIFDKASGKATPVKDFDVVGLRSGDKEYCDFTYQHKYHRIYLNAKLKEMSVYGFEGAAAKQIANLPLSDVILDSRDREIKFGSDSRPVSIEGGEYQQLYWQGDSLIFSLPDKKERVLISYKLESKKVSTQIVPIPKSNSKTVALAGDKVFVSSKRSYERNVGYDDSLLIQIFDVKKNFALLKTFTGSSVHGIRWKTTPFISSLGDTVENEWKPKKKNAELIYNSDGFISLRNEKDDTYAMTLGQQVYYSHEVGSLQAPLTSYTLGPVYFFRTCLSADFQPIPCTQPDAYQKAAARVYVLSREGKTSGGKKRFEEFTTMRFQNYVCLTYVDKEKDTYIVERFLNE